MSPTTRYRLVIIRPDSRTYVRDYQAEPLSYRWSGMPESATLFTRAEALTAADEIDAELARSTVNGKAPPPLDVVPVTGGLPVDRRAETDRAARTIAAALARCKGFEDDVQASDLYIALTHLEPGEVARALERAGGGASLEDPVKLAALLLARARAARMGASS